MPTVRFTRPFACGSRPAPDPFDKYLDLHGFYRKHTARDSTSLFRVMSEQLYDTQDHHKQLRKDCVNYMIKHREQYEKMVHGDFDEYVRDMAKIGSYGTLMELRAMGYLFKRNIILYRPFDMGVAFVEDADYKDPVVRVFHATHFDSVFEKSFIEKAAFCQSIVYEMLYKDVFKLPDIEYSVETMLYSDINHEPSKHEYENGDEYASHIVFEDGRKFQLDRPENTKCILSDPSSCHFHNEKFEENVKLDTRYEKSILSDKFISCVRQLIFDGITPFPYKVAKALDENIYRNVEIDSWNEMRKLSKLYRIGFKVGTECLVKLDETKNWLKCQIQAKEKDDSCVVYIEKLGERRSVACSSLRLLSGTLRDHMESRRNQYTKTAIIKDSIVKFGEKRNDKSYAKRKSADALVIDYDAICKVDLDTYIGLSNFNFAANNQQEITAYPMVYTQTTMNTNNNSAANAGNGKNAKNRNQNSQNHANVQGEVEKQSQVQISKNEDDSGYGKGVHEAKSEAIPPGNATPTYYPPQVQEQSVELSTPVHHHHVPNYFQQGPAPVYYCPSSEYHDQNVYSSDMVMPHGVYAIPAHAYQTPQMQPNMYAPIAGHQGAHYPIPVGGWPGYNAPMNPQGYVLSGPAPYALPAVPAPIPFNLPFLSRDLLRSSGRINFSPSYSYAPTAEDLPLNDKVSVRFYYNLGIEYFKLLQQTYGHGQLMAMIDGEPVANNYEQQPGDIESQQNQITSDLQQLSFDVNENENQSPMKPPKNYNDFGYSRRIPSAKYNNKRNDNRPSGNKHFQGTFIGPTSKTYNKNNQKYNNQSGSSSYDSTPMKESTGKSHQHGYGLQKQNVDVDVVNSNVGFGSNVPPFPYYDQTEPHYGPPGPNVVTRLTPPGAARPSSVPTAPYHHNHQMHGTYWLPTALPVSHPIQPQQPPSHSTSLNTSNASNPSL